MDIFATTTRDRLYDVGLLLFRITIACFMLTHGLPKLTMLFAEEPVQFADPLVWGKQLRWYLPLLPKWFVHFSL